MARARNIKPAFFTNEDLVELPFEDRLLFIGLWTIADREGRLEDRPKRIKMAVFPADNVDVDASLDRLAKSGFIARYKARGISCIQVLNFSKHQNPHVREAASELPTFGESDCSTVAAQCEHSASHADSLIPYSLNPESGEQSALPSSTDIGPNEAECSRLDAQPSEVSRKGTVCRLLRHDAGVADAAPHQLDDATWDLILAKRTDEEIVEFARAKVEARQGQRTGLRYLAPGLIEDPKPILPNARASPSRMTRDESRAIAAATRLSDFRAAVAADQGVTDERTIDATATTRFLG